MKPKFLAFANFCGCASIMMEFKLLTSIPEGGGVGKKYTKAHSHGIFTVL